MPRKKAVNPELITVSPWEKSPPGLVYGLDVDMMATIHRGDGFIPFMKKSAGGGLENLFCLSAADLKSTLPAVREWLLEDSYIAVNTFYKAGSRLHEKTGLPEPARKEFNLRFLNAVFVDLDFYKIHPDMKFPEAAYIAEKAMEKGLIPQASIIARSGRGLYLLWLLKQDSSTLPVRYWKEKLPVYKAMNRALLRLCKKLPGAGGTIDLNPDFKAVAGSQVLKTPGTIDSKSGNQVQYYVRFGDWGLITYRWKDMLDFLGSEMEKEFPPGGFSGLELPGFRPIKNRLSNPNRRAGWLQRNYNRLCDMYKLNAHLGGWPQGIRRRSLALMAEFYKYSTKEPDYRAIEKALSVVAADCRPPYPSDGSDTPVRVILKQVRESKSTLARAGNKAICEWYGIDYSLVENIGLESILPEDWKESRRIMQAEKNQGKKQLIEKSICNLYRQGRQSGKKKGSGVRAIARKMLENHGISISHETIRKILKRRLPEIAAQKTS